MNHKIDYLITSKEAAFVLGYKTPRSLSKLVEEGSLKFHSKTGRQIYFKLSTVMGVATPQMANLPDKT